MYFEETICDGTGARKETLCAVKSASISDLKQRVLIAQKGTRIISDMIGYARVSQEDQNPQYQLDALQAAGCARIFEDRMSGAEFSRAGLDQALAALEPGSVLVVWKLDRLGRSMLETVKIVLDLDRRGIGFRSLTESFDTKTALGRGVLALLAAVAEDERDRLRERTRAGMQAARRNGKHVGRPSTLTPEKLDLALRLIAEGKGKAAAARMVGVHPATLRRALNGPDDLRGSPAWGKGPASVRAGRRA